MSGRVLVLGNAGIDLSIRVPRLPRPGETLVGGAFRRAPGGKGLNQAVIAARVGVEVAFCAPLGEDADGQFIEAALRRERIARLVLPRQPGPTDTSVVMTAADGENCIVTAGDCADALPAATAAGFASGARQGDVLLLQGNLSLAATTAAARAGSEAGACVVLNAAPLRWPMQEVLPWCWTVVVNEGEAEALTGGRAHEAAAGLRALGAEVAVVTLGARGCLASGVLYPAPQVEAVDTTGAGDAFCGTFAACVARGQALARAITLAQLAAADTVRRRGAFESLPASFVALDGSC